MNESKRVVKKEPLSVSPTISTPCSVSSGIKVGSSTGGRVARMFWLVVIASFPAPEAGSAGSLVWVFQVTGARRLASIMVSLIVTEVTFASRTWFKTYEYGTVIRAASGSRPKIA